MKPLIIQTLLILFSISCFSQTMIFKKFKCEVSTEETKKIEQMIKFQSDYYETLFKIEIKTIKINLYGKLRMFKKIRDSITNLDSTTGFYAYKTESIYVYKSDNFLRTIYHEINHAIVRQIMRHVPAWINEGMAEFFEYFNVKSNGVSIKMQHGRLNQTNKWVKEKKINLQRFLNYSNSEWKRKNINPVSYSYTVSYSFICYLYLNYPGAIGTILKCLKKGKNSIEAIEIATKQKIEFIEHGFKAAM